MLLRSILVIAYQKLVRAASVNVLFGGYQNDWYLIFTHPGRHKIGPSFAMRLICLVALVGHFNLGTAYANPADDRLTFYFSATHNLSADTPTLSIEDNLSRSKWFDDKPSVKPVGKLELGAENHSTGYAVGLRIRTLNGTHSGSIAKYQCLLGFCGWIDGAAVAGDGVTDQVAYQIYSHQLWIKKSLEFSEITFGLIGGVNHIRVDSDIRSVFRNQDLKSEALLPFIGTDVRFRINESTSLICNLHYLNFSRNSDKAKFIDAELEVAYRLTKHLQIAVGSNSLTVHLRKQSNSGTAELIVPQRSPYVRMSFIY